MLAALEPSRAERIAVLEASGYPCYTTSPGWLGYDDEKLAPPVSGGGGCGVFLHQAQGGGEPG